MEQDYKIEKIRQFIQLLKENSFDSLFELTQILHVTKRSLKEDYLEQKKLWRRVCSEEEKIEIDKKIEAIKEAEEKYYAAKPREALISKYGKKRVEIARYLMKQFLTLEVQSMDDLADKLKYKPAILRQYLCNHELIYGLFERSEADKIYHKAKLCKEYDKKQYEEYIVKKIEESMEEYLSSRYSLEEICKKNHLNYHTLDKLFEHYEKFSGKPVDETLKDRLKARAHGIRHKKELRTTSSTLGQKTLKDSEYIKILKEDILEVSTYQLQLLKTVICYFQCQGNMKKVMELTGKSYNQVYTDLTSSSLHEMLDSESMNQLSEYLKVENILTSTNVSMKEQHDYIKKILQIFIENGYDILKTSENSGLADVLIIQVLKNPYIKVVIRDKVELNLIESIIQEYENNLEEKKK